MSDIAGEYSASIKAAYEATFSGLGPMTKRDVADFCKMLGQYDSGQLPASLTDAVRAAILEIDPGESEGASKMFGEMIRAWSTGDLSNSSCLSRSIDVLAGLTNAR